ncbi:hypothetical protein FOPG_18630 [Fusarium oxysporum f. sp. conglutinans race 2 54008]|uniref:Uncharacterized protein n=1 Tax=Fusarium oxysporum f. sp. conglutinans race 2 54008 TaxID=1089457 RepID=X0GP95_FUSOX|nr:hypothetical protein FOPG_18630 [Fusarium oxysporum f. sp. conglutinans race 2 54008]
MTRTVKKVELGPRTDILGVHATSHPMPTSTAGTPTPVGAACMPRRLKS